MERRKSLPALAIVMALLLSASALSIRGERPSVGHDPIRVEEIFTEKTLVIEVDRLGADDSSATVLVNNASLIKLGDQNFIVGVSYESEDGIGGSFSGPIEAVPCNKILRIQAMTKEQFKQYAKTWTIKK